MPEEKPKPNDKPRRKSGWVVGIIIWLILTLPLIGLIAAANVERYVIK